MVQERVHQSQRQADSALQDAVGTARHYNYQTAFILLGETLEHVPWRSQATASDSEGQDKKEKDGAKRSSSATEAGE
jgi:hypothetical protein